MSARMRPATGPSGVLIQTTLIILALGNAAGEILTPPYFNLALGKKVTATATCGDEGPELYCKLVGANAERDIDLAHVIQGQVCDTCDIKSQSKRHPPEYAVDGMETWWQSPPLSRGMKYNEVNLTIDLGQEFHVAYVFVRMGNSPRPGLWALEKSTDYGKTFKPWQYFSDSPQDCEIYFGKESLHPITRDDSVICSTEYSQIVPLEGGEIPISLLNYRPSAKMYFNSSVLQEWTRATNVRLRLLKTKNLLGHLMSVARQDPTVTRRYFYSIKDISIGGRCMCNGHADTCDPAGENLLKCRCQHNTCGPQCATCCTGFEQKKWRISQNWNQFSCEPCNCHNHTTECTYDAEVDAQRLSLDIQGNYEGGGVCSNCQHNTEGINCNKCKPTYYRPYDKRWNELDVCQPCNCNYHNLTGNCEEGSGRCECRPEFNPPNCDSCRFGYFDYPDCKPCPCNLNGTEGSYCTPREGLCTCKPNYSGTFCFDCADGYYSAQCKGCECNLIGSVSSTCDKASGNCTCKSKFSGRTCSECEAGFYDYPTCSYCNCDSSGTVPGICDAISGQCICKEGFSGARCDQCIAGYYMEVRGRERACVPCNCSTIGSASTSCAATGKCTCLSNFGSKQCDQCSPGHYRYPECLPCNCDQFGSIGVSCDEKGQCQCKKNFDKQQCNTCKEHFYNYPACEECNCDPNGVIPSFAGCGSVSPGQLCQCKRRVQGRICNDCKPLFWNLQDYNPQGCEDCGCNLAGTQGGIGVCDTKTGQCSCKLAVGERSCTQCQDGFYNLTASNLLGCTDCDCDIGGSVDNNCEKKSGQCKCHSRIVGRRCDKPIQAHYFPTLHQFQFEVENGRTPTNEKVRYDFSDDVFPGYSWEGYAVFAPPLLTEVINDVQIHKSSVYRMVIRYVNPGRDNIVASVTITPDNPSNIVQRFTVLLKPTSEPQFVTVSGDKGATPSHFVMDPGKWEVSIKTNKNVYIDYFVLIPQAYYEATVLTKQVEKPCMIGEQKLCRHFAYPSLAAFSTIKGSGVLNPVTEYIDNPQQLAELEASPLEIPIISETQEELNFEITVPYTGPYIFLIEYVTPADSSQPAGGTITIKVSSGGNSASESYAVVNLNDCPYSSACRQVLVDELAKVQVIDVQDVVNHIFIQGDRGTFAGIKSIVAIPAQDWHLDYITPRPFCVKKNGKCTPAVFTAAVDSKKVEFESAATVDDSATRPYILDNTTQVVYLRPDDSYLTMESKVPAAGNYMFVIHYYQPDHPESTINVVLQADGQSTEAILPITHCPSNSGCRSVVQQPDGNTRFHINDNFTLSFKEKSGKGVWLDYFLIVASADYVDTVLKEANTLDYTREFITTCAQNHYQVNITDEGFCRDSIFSITSDYNNGALQCFCDSHGSVSHKCNLFGGQCDCRPNIIGRTCKQCRPGYYGFPNCQPCDCPSKKCADDGSCVCPNNVEGERCDHCKPETYGFDLVVGCRDCNCHSLGVVGNKLQCDLFNGSCECKENVVGQSCDRCVAGNFAFPYCTQCNCNLAGTIDDVCDQNTADCFCKANVGGNACDTCLDGHFDLQSDNPEGCTKCFCFGKATRCTKSYHLFWAQLHGMENWYMANVATNGSVNVYLHVNPPQYFNNSMIGAELATAEAADKVVYFGAPQQFLGQKLSSYGGYLNYTIYYTTGPFGNAIAAPDVIIEGPLGYIVHNSLEQPPANAYWAHSLRFIESEFSTLDDGIVSRELLMSTLDNIKSLYIRATYWETSVITRLQGVTLDVGLEMDWSIGAVVASSVEQCTCPSAYKGLSCEQCADGHYRLDSGPHGGFCVPCQCHGHSSTCDVNTGVCLNCQDYTTGDHCEQCVAGYHGNATIGMPSDCLICACPLPIVSNNFAYSCRVDHSGSLISCECPEGYRGPRCEYCAAGYYGEPETAGDYCKPCNCSGNIDVADSGSCDSRTGDCLKCANNTYGGACHICAPGFFGDAINLKNCQSCICDENGMDYCDNTNGRCVCKPGVVGEKCDRCEAQHWGLATGRGCTPCDCGVASESRQCEEETGQCRCAKGVTGQKCDVCAAGYWNYTKHGCDHCNCNTGYSVGFRCNEQTGHCECLPGAIGSKCEQCPHRWVLIPKVGCEGCDSCTGDLLDSVEELNRTLTPVALEFKFKATSFFTTQRLHYIAQTMKQLKPMVRALDPARVDLTAITGSIDELENKAKNLNRSLTRSTGQLGSVATLHCQMQRCYTYGNAVPEYPLRETATSRLDRYQLVQQMTQNFWHRCSLDYLHTLQQRWKWTDETDPPQSQYAKNDSDTNVKRAAELITSAEDVLEKVRQSKEEAKKAVQHVADLAVSLELGEQPKIDSALADARQIKSDIMEKHLTPQLNRSAEMLQNSRDLEERMNVFVVPVYEQNKTFQDLRKDINDFTTKLKKMREKTEEVDITISKGIELNNENSASKFTSKVNTVNKQNQKAYEDIVLTAQLLVNASIAQTVAAQLLANIPQQKEQTQDRADQTQQLIDSYKVDQPDLEEKLRQANDHAGYLARKADELSTLLNRLNNSKTDDAYRAASSYSSIVKSVREAKDAVNAAEQAINNITKRQEEKLKNANPTYERSIALQDQALGSVRTLAEMTPRLNAAEANVTELSAHNQTTHNRLNAIESFLNDKIPLSLNNFLALRDSMLPSHDVTVLSRDILTSPSHEFLRVDLPRSRELAQNLYKQAADANKNNRSIENQVNHIKTMQPEIERLLLEVDNTKRNFDRDTKNADHNLEKLKEKIRIAKDISSRIQVGVSFDEKSTLQPETPSNVDEMGTSTHVSAYFRTREENGFLLYLGNPEGTKLRRTRSDDFMALEIANGYPYLLIDIGDSAEGREPARINSKKKVSDNKWYQVVVDRVGKNVKLTIREALENGTEIPHTTELVLPGQHTIFNLDKEQSKLYVGGYPSNAKMQSQVRFSSFNGQIEEVVVGDTPVGLWNFQQAENLQGARARDQLKSSEESTGYRFNGDGFASVDARPSVTRNDGISVSLKFRTYAPDGLLYLLGTKESFLSLEMREGNLFLQYRLDGDVVTVGTAQTFNDGKWHHLTARRYLKNGTLQVDSYLLPTEEQGESNGSKTEMRPADVMYFGGYPVGKGFTEITNKGFDGCIDDVTVITTLINLKEIIGATGVSAGCQYANLVSLDGVSSFLRYQNSSSADMAFQLSLRFKTAAPDGLIFYATNRDQSMGISLSLDKGKLVLLSQKENLDTGSNTYNDDQWHVVTATHGRTSLNLAIDDYDNFSTDSPPPALLIMNGELLLGGAPPNYMIAPGMTATRQPFAGCLGDATANGQVISFGAAVSSGGATIGRCGKRTSTSGVVTPDFVRPVFRGGILETKTEVTEPPIPPLPEIPTTESVPQTVIPLTAPAPTVTTTTTTTTPAPQPTTKRPPPVIEEGCALGIDPTFTHSSPETGYRFGTRFDSHIEFGRLPSRQSTGYDLSVAFNTTSSGGLMLYSKHSSNAHFVALFMHEGKLHLFYNCDTENAKIVVSSLYNDGVWHQATLSLDDGRAKLSVDDVLVGETSSRCIKDIPPQLQKPFYLGGVANFTDIRNREALGSWNYSPFDGCMKDLKMNGVSFTDIAVKTNVLPCRQSAEEQGVFFRPPGGYLKLLERFKVGTDMSIQLEIKARNSSGLLVSVHGRKDYLILEIVENEVILRVENGKGPIEAVFNLGNKHLLCDGQWHTIYAIKSRHVVSLVVDGHFSDAGVGLSASADTRSALFIGGHPNLHHSLRGARSRHGFTGCMKNISIRDNAVPIRLNATYGAVSVGMCPTD